MRCPAERGQDTDNQIKGRRDTRHFASFGEEELFGFMLSDVASIAKEDSNGSEGGDGCADCKVMLRGPVEGSRNLALQSRERSGQLKGHKLRHGALVRDSVGDGEDLGGLANELH